MSSMPKKSKSKVKNWYTFRPLSEKSPNTFSVFKYDADLNFLHQYHLAVVPNTNTPTTCSCWAGGKWCRHKKMFLRFCEENRLDSGWMYSPDTEEWKEPEKPEDEE